ncbi:cisplatin damage response ATP-dependent DNA ligase [Thioclava kandeliae]|uniref:DNA ligase (ATP) n=1 Tax=Thioclava kandeliae TaxID=3070818 RepID=A0ABV1SC99_9RHOB
MRAFAGLLEHLAYTGGRNAKLAYLAEYFAASPDPDRGYALAALTGDLSLGRVQPALLRAMVAQRVDAELFTLSYDFVGDLAETIALIWPEPAATIDLPLGRVVETLLPMSKPQAARQIAHWLDQLSAPERLALLKLATGGLRVGVSARLARVALAQMGAQMGGPTVEEIEELWHGLAPPYTELFAWIEGGARPAQAAFAPFRPVMLSTPVTDADLPKLAPADYVAEWKWDGIRVQAVSESGTRRIYSRTGDDISGSFPDLVEAMAFEGALDGELLIRRGDQVAPFADLQKRLGRKKPSQKMMAEAPAALRAYDILTWEGEDLRGLAFDARRARLERAVAGLDPRIDASPLLPFADWGALAALRADPPEVVIEGVMLKRHDSAYQAGRPRGPWFKWKREARLVDAVLLYGQRGHGKRSGFYSDFTFALWDGAAPEAPLVPVGKAYSGFTDEELRRLDRFVRSHTRERFGPVRSLEPKLVVEVAFEGLNRSSRHKSGVAMRFPRISRIRWDKPAEEADQLNSLLDQLPPEG